MVPFLVLDVAFALLRLVGLGWLDDWQAASAARWRSCSGSPLIYP